MKTDTTKRVTAFVTIDDVEYVVAARVTRYPSDPEPWVDFLSVVQDGADLPSVADLPDSIVRRLEQSASERADAMTW